MIALKATLEQWIGLPTGARVATLPYPVRVGPSETVLDLTIMTQTFGEINDEARAMFQLFIDSIRPLIGRFETELESRHLETACETIHRARGAAANAGGRELAAIMERIEAALVGQDAETLASEVPSLRPAWNRLVNAIATT